MNNESKSNVQWDKTVTGRNGWGTKWIKRMEDETDQIPLQYHHVNKECQQETREENDCLILLDNSVIEEEFKKELKKS